MKHMKRFQALFITFTLISFSLVGCTSKTNNESTETNTETSAVSESTNTDNLSPTYDEEDFVSTWNDSTATHIALNNSSATVTGSGASAINAIVTITAPGTFVVTGTISEGQIVINVTEKGTVRIILNGANLTNTKTVPINVIEAKKVLFTLADGTTNSITDKARTSTADEEYSAAIYSTADTVINGSGKLTINANYKDGITSKDDLFIISGDINVTANDDGIIGKDLLHIYNGNITVNAGGDGLKSTYDTDTTKGDILINNGTINITSKNDAIQAENILKIVNGTLTLKTGGGSSSAIAKSDTNPGMFGNKRTTTATTASADSTESMKALKSNNYLYITGGSININAQDDGLHTNGSLLISGGTMEIAAGSKAFHGDNLIQLDNGSVTITTCYEGLEAKEITVNGGELKITSNDDGFNASEATATTTSNQSGSPSSSNCNLNINGGTVYVNAAGDGLDSNGYITMTGGSVYVDGPTDNGNGAIDYNNGFIISGGTLIAAGSSGMADAPTAATNGGVISMTFSSSKTAKTTYAINDSSGKTIIEYTPSKTYANVVIYSSGLATGNAYTVVSGGSNVVSATTSNAITYMNESGITTGNAGASMGGGMQPPNNQGKIR